MLDEYDGRSPAESEAAIFADMYEDRERSEEATDRFVKFMSYVAAVGLVGAVLMAANDVSQADKIRHAFEVNSGEVVCPNGQKFNVKSILASSREAIKAYTLNPNNHCGLQ